MSSWADRMHSRAGSVSQKRVWTNGRRPRLTRRRFCLFFFFFPLPHEAESSATHLVSSDVSFQHLNLVS